jgi:hypothetical protein
VGSIWLRKAFLLRLALVILGLIAIWLLGHALFRRIRVSRSYTVHASYLKMPANDTMLANWLKNQPGVVAHTVHIDRKGKIIYVTFVKSDTISQAIPFPDLSSACDQYGYAPPSKWNDD